MLARKKINIAAAEGRAELLIFRFRVQTYDCLTGLPDVCEQQLQKVALALTGVAENEDVGGRLVLGTAVEVYQHIAPELVPSDIQSLRIRFAGEVERVQIGRAGRGQHPLILRAELICAHRQSREKALFLP